MAEKKKRSDNLRPASFRGVPFQVESGDLSAGRRTQVHEYPKRDEPYVEDLGRATREFKVVGFVIGDNYIDQANKLLAALETAGSGTLIHPWLGTLKVSLKEPAAVSFDGGLGLARISMAFVEAGELTFPAASDSTQAKSRVAAGNLQTASVNNFASKFNVSGTQDFVSALASGNLTAALNKVATGVPGLSGLSYGTGIAASLSSALSLISNPLQLGWKVAGLLGIAELASAGLQWATVARALTQLAGDSSLANPPAPTVVTPDRTQAYQNNVAVNSLVRQTLLVQAVGASSLAPVTVQDDAVVLRNQLAAALDAEALTASDDVYVALIDARGDLWVDLTSRARDSARLQTRKPAQTTPALVLAYDWYEDATRAGDIVTRNKIHHPGFVPPVNLQVLNR